MKKIKKSKLFEEFKKFITKGNVVDMAIGVIIGSAFSAIVTAVVQKILMPIITWAIPTGGMDGLVTVLNPEKAQVVEGVTKNTIQYWGVTYDADVVNVINWGAFLNSVIYFLAVALLLFSILKIFTYLKTKREKFKAAELEKYYEKHPEERPKPVDPVKPKPTELEVLMQIRDTLITQKEAATEETK